MKSFLASVALASYASAMQLEYAMGDAPELDESVQAFDPERLSNYTGITGRGETEEGADTMKNVLIYEEAEGDEKYRPMCNVGGILDQVDTEGPSDECCRVYEQDNFMGRRYDFCLYGVDDHDDNYQKYWQADTYGWHNEINSYHCGRKVGIRLCAHPGDTSTTADKAAVNECRGGNDNVIEDFGRRPFLEGEIVDEADSVWLFKKPRHFAVIYEMPDCKGPSWIAFPNARQRYLSGYDSYGTGSTAFEGSWDFYDGLKKFNPEGIAQLNQGSSESVRLTPRLEMELFVTTRSTTLDDNHMSLFERENAYTLRNFTDRVTCHDYPKTWWNENGRGSRTGISGVMAIKVRQMYMPPAAVSVDEDL